MKSKQNTVLITGGTSGIGLALANKFLEEENKVIITGRSLEKIKNIKERCRNFIIERVDVTNEDEIKKLSEKHCDVNILINNAGVHHDSDLQNDAEVINFLKEDIFTNLLGPMLLTKYFLPHLLIKKNAAIINVTSYFGIVPNPIALGYCASKAGLRSFTKALRGQLINTKIKVFDLAPPIVDTPMSEAVNKPGIKKMTTDELVSIFWNSFLNNKYETYPGLSKIVYLLNRLSPGFIEKKIRQITKK